MASENDARQFAWDSFSKTGQIGYYLFYRALTFGETDGFKDEGDSTQEKRVQG